MLHPDAAAVDLDAVLAAWASDGYAVLGRVLDDDALESLRSRADDIMLGRVPHDPFFFQRDAGTGKYEDLAFGRGWEGPTLDYRKIEKLERDPIFHALVTHAAFERIARAIVPGAIAIYRAMLMNKPAGGGTVLPWHQDGGRLWGLDRDPELQIWVALDDAPVEAGCVEVVPGSHAGGLARPLGGMIPADVVAASGADDRAVLLPARAGEALLLHNYVWHRSGTNRSGRARRAFTVCYMSAATRCVRTRRAPRTFFEAFPSVGGG